MNRFLSDDDRDHRNNHDDEFEPDLSVIEANIVTNKRSHKGIIIGKNGEKMKELSMVSRKKLEEFLQRKVYLQLWVKVDEDWRSKKESLVKYGYLDD